MTRAFPVLGPTGGNVRHISTDWNVSFMLITLLLIGGILWLLAHSPSAFSPFFPESASILRKATHAATTPMIRSTASPTPPEAQGLESRKVQTLLKTNIEAPMSTSSIQMIFFIVLPWSDKPPGSKKPSGIPRL